MRVIVTEAFRVELGPLEFSSEEARATAADMVGAANRADIEMEDHIATSRRRGWVAPVAGGEVVL